MVDFLFDEGKNKIEGLKKTEINEALNSKADAQAVANAFQSVNEALNGKASTQALNEAVQDINTALNDKVSKSELEQEVAEVLPEAMGNNYYNKTQTNDLLAEKAPKNQFDEVRGIYLLDINETEFIDNKYLGIDGKEYNHNDYKISPYILCDFNKIKFNCLTASSSIACIAFYRNSNELSFLGYYSNTQALSTYPTHEMDVPSETKYIRISKQKNSFYVGNVAPYVMSIEKYATLNERIIAAENTATEAHEIAQAGSINNIYRVVKNDINLVPSSGEILHSYLNDSGEVKTATNPESTNYQMCISGYIPVEEGKTLYLSGDTFIYWRYFGWYDSNKNYLGGKDDYNAMDFHNHVAFVDVPTNAKYLRITCNTVEDLANTWADYTGTAPTNEVIFSTDQEHLDYGYYPTNPCYFNGKDISVFNKIICIGDSITEGYFNKTTSGGAVISKYSYPTILQKLTGVACENKGTSGATSVSWWASHSSDDFLGFDCAIINFGINDALQNIPESDMRAAFANIINALKNANTGIKIFIANVNPAYSRGNTTYNAVNAIIKDIAENTIDCFFVDLTTNGLTVGVGYVYGHLTACGYRQLAKDYLSYISYIIRNNPEAFRYIQFIGSEFYPT